MRLSQKNWNSTRVAKRINCLSALALNLALALAPCGPFGAGVASARSPGAERIAASPLSFEASNAENPSFFQARGLNYQIRVTRGGSQILLHNPQLSRGSDFGPQKTSIAPFRHQAMDASSPDFALRTPDLLSNHAPSSQPSALAVTFIGSNPEAALNGDHELPGRINYLRGNSPAAWRTGLKTYAAVRVRGVYAGIDLVYYGNQECLEYDFLVQPGADPAGIVMQVDGADEIAVGAEGALGISLNGHKMIQHQPRVYQVIHGQQKFVNGTYRVIGKNKVGFEIGDYDRGHELVIDPILSYATFFGGNEGDLALAVKLDASGYIYVAGETLSTEFPFPVQGFQTNFAGGKINGDAFVAKFDPTGSSLVYFTYLGGKGNDGAHDLALDSNGDAYITGFTDSPDFPVTAQAYDRKIGGKPTSSGVYFTDAFVAKLDSSGAGLIFSTYLGGDDVDVADAIAVDPSGYVYITGYTYSTTAFPTVNALPGQNTFRGVYDAFVAKFDPTGSSLVYCTYLGGNQYDEGQGIAADPAGFAYVTGYTASTNFPTTNAFRKLLNGWPKNPLAYDAFITKIAPAGGTMEYSTLLGGTNTDSGFRIAVDAANNVFVTGGTRSADFPNTVTNFVPLSVGFTNNKAANYDCFLAKVNADGSFGWASRFGGDKDDVGWDLALDAGGHVFVIGTGTTNFPVYNDSGFPVPQKQRGATNIVFVTGFNTDGSGLLYSVVLGGSANDRGFGIAADPAGNVYITGRTFSTNFPLAAPMQSSLLGGSDTFLAKMSLEPVLKTASRDGQLELKWRAYAPEYQLETSAESAGNAGWGPLPAAPVLKDGWHTVTLGSTNEGGFYRLKWRDAK